MTSGICKAGEAQEKHPATVQIKRSTAVLPSAPSKVIFLAPSCVKAFSRLNSGFDVSIFVN